MADDKSSFPPRDSGQEESLSATGMFRRVFEVSEETAAASSSAQEEHVPARDDRPAPVAGTPSSTGASGSLEAGEFTRLFQRVQSGPSESSQDTSSAEMPAATDGAGEFTRVFLKGGSGQSSEGAHKPGDHPRNTVQQRGFSSPGKSESAAAEGSVTQLFRTPSAIPAVQPAAPKSSPELNLSVTLTPPSDQPAASSESLSRPREAASLGPATNITGLLESLSTPDRPRNEPASASPQFPPGGAIESGGVTKFIQKLSEEPPIPVPAPSQAAERPEQSGPGEFTRVIARVEEKPVSPKPAEQAVVTAPPAPRVMSAAPSLPPAPSAKTPPAPKPSEPPKVPSQSKTKLETIAPVLTALNTVLLIAVLLVLILLLRSR